MPNKRIVINFAKPIAIPEVTKVIDGKKSIFDQLMYLQMITDKEANISYDVTFLPNQKHASIDIDVPLGKEQQDDDQR